MNRQWNVWFQHSDFSSDDFGGLNREQAIVKFNGLDIQTECKDMSQRIVAKQEWCQFGMGFNGSDQAMAHIYIEDENLKSFTLMVERPHKKKLEPIPKPHVNSYE